MTGRCRTVAPTPARWIASANGSPLQAITSTNRGGDPPTRAETSGPTTTFERHNGPSSNHRPPTLPWHTMTTAVDLAIASAVRAQVAGATCTSTCRPLRSAAPQTRSSRSRHGMLQRRPSGRPLSSAIGSATRSVTVSAGRWGARSGKAASRAKPSLGDRSTAWSSGPSVASSSRAFGRPSAARLRAAARPSISGTSAASRSPARRAWSGGDAFASSSARLTRSR